MQYGFDAARLPIWFAEHKNDPEIKELSRTREIWFMPIMNVDGYDFTFTCGTGAAQVSCDYRVRTADDTPVVSVTHAPGLAARPHRVVTIRDGVVAADGGEASWPPLRWPASRSPT